MPIYEPNSEPGVTLPVSLRDWFAGQIAQGDGPASEWERTEASIAARCRLYFRIADAMLAARQVELNRGETT